MPPPVFSVFCDRRLMLLAHCDPMPVASAASYRAAITANDLQMIVRMSDWSHDELDKAEAIAMTQVIDPWSPYLEAEAIVANGRRTLVSAFADLVLVQSQFAKHELPEIFAAPEDEGENDVCRHLVQQDAVFLTEQFVRGGIATFARPVGGGDVVEIPAEYWEIDNPLIRMATGAFNLEHWACPDAPITHRIFVDGPAFEEWLAGLETPGALTDEELEEALDPRLRAKRSVAARKRAKGRKIAGRVSENATSRVQDASLAVTVEPLLLTIKEVRQLTRLGHNTIYKMIQQGSFPKQIKRGRSARWLRSKVEEWVAAQASEQGAD